MILPVKMMGRNITTLDYFVTGSAGTPVAPPVAVTLTPDATFENLLESNIDLTALKLADGAYSLVIADTAVPSGAKPIAQYLLDFSVLGGLLVLPGSPWGPSPTLPALQATVVIPAQTITAAVAPVPTTAVTH